MQYYSSCSDHYSLVLDLGIKTFSILLDRSYFDNPAIGSNAYIADVTQTVSTANAKLVIPTSTRRQKDERDVLQIGFIDRCPHWKYIAMIVQY